MKKPKNVTGKLLVATPALEDPNFAKTVVFMIEHTDEGALGVVLNRPSPIRVTEMIPQWADRVGEPQVIFLGGPVSTEGVIAVGQSDDSATPEQQESAGFQRFGDNNLGTVDLNQDPLLVGMQFPHLRMFAGHAGWGAGQLDTELRRDGWYILEASHQDVFSPDPTPLWFHVLGRQKGQLSWLAHYPDDPKHN